MRRQSIGRTLECLEPRTLFAVAPPTSPATITEPTVRVVIDYSLDSNRFFDTQQKKDLLQQAADSVARWMKDELLAINPSGGDTWEAVFDHPATGARRTARNLVVPANEVLLFAGGRDMSDALGRGGPGGYNASGLSAWLDRVGRRGQGGPNSAEFGPWGGAITFDTSPASPWHFGPTTAGLSGSNDFLSVATHEVAHLLGFGTSDSWRQFTSGGAFTGQKSVAEYDGAGPGVPLNDDASHWAEGTRDGGQEVAMDPQITIGTRHLLTPLDLTALDDIGWSMPPQASLSAAGVTAAGTTPHTFTVAYAHYTALNSSTFGADDLTAIAPDGTVLPAAFVRADGAGAARTVTYSLAAPGGTWDAADNGTYSIVLAADAVRSTIGEPVASGTLGTFVADVSDPPAGQLQPAPEPALGAAGQSFTVVYTDGVAVDPATIDAGDVVVTGPDGAPLPPASLMAVTPATPGASVSATYAITAPGGAWGPEDDGRYTVLLAAGAVSDTSGNVSAGGPVGAFEVTLGAIDFNARAAAVYTDASGDTVIVSMKGPGTGTVRFAGTRPADATGIDLRGTAAATTLLIRTGPAGTSTGDVTVDGALKAFTGKFADLTGALSVGGPLGKVLLRSAAGGAVTAPSVRSITVRGNFSADVAVGTIGVLKIAGALAGADVRANSLIGKVIAGSVRDSRLLAGVAGPVQSLPQSADFVNRGAVIRSVAIRTRIGAGFSNALVAAPTIGRLSLGAIQTANAAVPFGVAADRVTWFSGIATGGAGVLRRSRLDDPADSVSDGDFSLRVL